MKPPRESSDVPPRLIECGDHSFSPWGVVCVHVLDGTATDLIHGEADDGDEGGGDWMCPECCERAMSSGGDDSCLSYLRAACIHCIRKVIENYGRRD